jgi:lipoate-protein ligase A|tara:strand:+ start:809 stop:1672 length:864 start_codon:yes stop_codon:yes gene_type:complete
MKIKYVDLGGVSKEMYTGLWEYDNVVDLKEPILIKFSTNKTLVSFWQGPYWNEESQEWESVYSDLSDYFYSSELSDIFKVRLYEKLEIPYNADMVYYVESPDVTDFLLFYPDIGRLTVEQKNIRSNIMDMILESISKVLRKNYSIKTRCEGNDIFFKSDDKWKKFVGSMYRPSRNNWGHFDISLTYKFDSEIANRVRTFDTKVRVKKFDVEDISNMVGGLWEVNPTIEKNKLETEIINLVVDELNLTIKNDSLTNEEESKLLERGNRRLTEKEWYLYGNNDGFDIGY